MPEANGGPGAIQRDALTRLAACGSLRGSIPAATPAATSLPPTNARRHRAQAYDPRQSMELREFFSEDAIKLELEGTTKDEILKELIGLLKLDEKSEGMLFKMLKRRENLGSTGIGRNIAIPHCRSLVVNKLRVAFGRKSQGLDFKAIDEKTVKFFFLIVAPPLEVSNQYLPVLGKIAQFSKEADVPDRLLAIQSPSEFMALLEEKGV
jgi:mannitol/fructose-specific phosphotransferase system IIA component (Ntr-type)